MLPRSLAYLSATYLHQDHLLFQILYKFSGSAHIWSATLLPHSPRLIPPLSPCCRLSCLEPLVYESISPADFNWLNITWAFLNQNVNLGQCLSQKEPLAICWIKLAMAQTICYLLSLIFLNNKTIFPAGRLFCENKLECLLWKAKLIWGLLCQSCLPHLFGNANIFPSESTCQINWRKDLES